MQHDHFQRKKNWFWPFDPIQVPGARVKFCLYVVAHFIPLNLICIFWKSLFLTASEAKVTVTKKWYVTLRHLKMHPHQIWYSYLKWYRRSAPAMKLRSEFKVTVTRKTDLTFWPHSGVRNVCKGEIFACMMLSCISFPLIWYATWPYSEKVDFNRVRGQGQGHSDPKMVWDTPPSQDASTHQIWDSYLSEARHLICGFNFYLLFYIACVSSELSLWKDGQAYLSLC